MNTSGLLLGGTAGGPSPMIPQYSSGNQRGTTRSAIADSTIEVTDAAHQAQDLASLSRDTFDTQRTVERTPDLQHKLDKQANLMAAAQAAGAVVTRSGGNALTSAAGAGLSSSLPLALDRWANEVANSLNTGSADLDQALGNAAANLAAGGLGVLVGGDSGAETATNTDRLNRQLHPHESKSGWICNAAKARARSTDMRRS